MELTKAQKKEVDKEVKKQIASKIKEALLEKPITLIERAKQETVSFKMEFRKQTTTAIIAAFGLVIALSWQEVIKKIVDSVPKSGILIYHPYLTDVYTALIVTFVAVIGIMLVSRWAKSKENLPQ